MVVEARSTATAVRWRRVLVQSGTLNLRDVVVAGATWGRVKAMFDDRGKRVRRAEPSMPVEILGLLEVPQAGDTFQVFEDEKVAREIAEQRAGAAPRRESLVADRPVKLTRSLRQVKDGDDRRTARDRQGGRAGLAGRDPDRAAEAERGSDRRRTP